MKGNTEQGGLMSPTFPVPLDLLVGRLREKSGAEWFHREMASLMH